MKRFKQITPEQIDLQTTSAKNCVDLMRIALNMCDQYGVHVTFDAERQAVYFMDAEKVSQVWDAHINTDGSVHREYDCVDASEVMESIEITDDKERRHIFSTVSNANTLMIIRRDPLNIHDTWEEEDSE